MNFIDRFLVELPERLAAVTSVELASAGDFVSKRPLSGSDHVVATATEHTRRLFCLFHKAGDDLEAACAEAAEQCARERRESPTEDEMAKIIRLYQDNLLLKDLFFGSVRFDYPELVGKGSVGMYAGWKLAWSDEARDPLSHHQGGTVVVGIIPAGLEEMLFGDGSPFGRRPTTH